MKRQLFRAIRFAVGTFAGLAFVVPVPSLAACPYTFDTSSIVTGQPALAKPISDNFNYIIQCPNFTGNVGIGTTTPTQKLDISGPNNVLALRATSGYAGYVLYSGSVEVGDFGYAGAAGSFGGGAAAGDTVVTNLGASSKLDFATGVGPTVHMVIDASGNVGIGTTAPAYSLDVAGYIRATNVSVSSDSRLKTKITSLKSGALNNVMALHPVTFQWKDPKSDEMKGAQTGLIAQEVEKILPSVVLTGKDANRSKSIKYSELTAILIKAVQEQQAMINKQAEGIRLLNKQNADLEARLKRVEQNRVASLH